MKRNEKEKKKEFYVIVSRRFFKNSSNMEEKQQIYLSEISSIRIGPELDSKTQLFGAKINCQNNTNKKQQHTTMIINTRQIPTSFSALKFILYLIFIQFYGFTLIASHSNINSVWLSKDSPEVANHSLQISSAATNLPEHRQQQSRANNKDHSLVSTKRSGDSWLPSPESSLFNGFLTQIGNNHSTSWLQTSSSSLQPSIAVLDTNESISERRFDSDNFSSDNNGSSSSSNISSRSSIPHNITSTAYGAFTDGASSLDHLWAINQTNNAQVQFDPDEEHNLNSNTVKAGSTSAGSSNKSLTDRRQDLNETSTLAPQHDSPAPNQSTSTSSADSNPIDSSSPIDDLPLVDNKYNSSRSSQQSNYLVGNVNNDSNELKRDLMAYNVSQNLHEQNNNRSLFDYYQTLDRNKWNPTTTSNSLDEYSNQDTRQHEQVQNNHRRNSFGTNPNKESDFYSISPAAIGGNSNNPSASSYTRTGGGSNTKNLNYPNYYYATTNTGSAESLDTRNKQVYFSSNSRRLNNFKQQEKTNFDRHWKSPTENLHYGFLPQTSQAPHLLRTTPIPHTTYSPTTTIYTTNKPPLDYHHHNRNRLSRLPVQQLRPLNRVVTHPPRKPYNYHDHRLVGEEFLVDNRRDFSNLWRQKPSISRSRQYLDLGQRPSFLHNPYNMVSRRPVYKTNNNHSNNKPAKKSILGSLGSKLNSWVNVADSNGGKEKIEDSFYETSGSHQSRRKIKPPAHWNTPANVYYINAAPQAALASVLDPSYLQPHLTAPSQHLYPATSGQTQLLAGGSSEASNYYPASYLSHPNHLISPQLVPIRQPTVAPASIGSLDKFYAANEHLYAGSGGLRSHSKRYPINSLDSHLTQSSHHLSQFVPHHQRGSESQAGNFIPVVAVSVTKTSPAPKPMEQQDSYMANNALDQDMNSELIDYLEMKTGDGFGSRNRNNNRLHNGRHNNNYDMNMVRAQLDNDFGGNLASGSVSRDTTAYHQQYRPINSSGKVSGPTGGEHTTTVKSAIFGYLPHEANKPLLQAMSMLPPDHNPTRGQLSLNDAYVGQLSEHNPAHTLLNQNHQYPTRDTNDLLALDEPPSLGLQLQANNFAQNDIAHPFSASSSSSSSSPSTQRNKLHSGGLQSLLNQQQQASGLRTGSGGVLPVPVRAHPIEVYPTSQHQYHGFQFLQPAESGFVAPHHLNPLLTATDSQQHQQQHQQHQSGILTAAATELSPVLPAAVMFAASPAYALHTATDPASALTDNQQSGAEEDNEADGSTLNKGNKKRSSDFFASAGQLLLSALPLLLAPTLGLMFASSPLPVARYQAPNTFSGSGSMHSSIPGEYLNSLNIGQVSNASPMPQLFTPSPPGYNVTTVRPAANKQQVASNRFAASASNPIPSIKNRSTTPTPQKLTVTLTTLGPPVFINETEIDSDNNNNNNNGGDHSAGVENYSGNKVQTIDHHHHHHHVGNTILLLADEDNENALNVSDFKNHTTVDIAGYEGVDYDAQFANLKKHGILHQQAVSTSDNSSADSAHTTNQIHELKPINAPIKPKPNKHQYIGVDSSLETGNGQTDNQQTQTVTRPTRPEEDDVSTKLYPVSTWPPMRRRTVSLVTSNGNKTLLDASEKYQNIDYYNNQTPVNNNNNNSGSGSGNRLATTNYTTTFDDSIDEPEVGVYNSSLSYKPIRKLSSQVGDKPSHHDALDFMFSDGLSTVSLTREPFISRLSRANNNGTKLERFKRDISNNKVDIANETSYIQIDGRPVRVVKRVIRLAPKTTPNQVVNVTSGSGGNEEKKLPNDQVVENSMIANGSLAESASSLDLAPRGVVENEDGLGMNGIEPLKIDDSKSKSAHIVATMIARLDDEEEAAAAAKRHDSPLNDPYYQQPVGPSGESRFTSGGSSSDTDELKELLLQKKALLAQIVNANRSRISSPEVNRNFMGRTNQQESGSRLRMGEDLNQFSAGGRGRIPPIEVAPVIKIKLYNGQNRTGKPRVGVPIISNSGKLEMSEETKKALANFGSLMIKDSLQQDKTTFNGQNKDELVDHRTLVGNGSNRNEKQVKRWRTSEGEMWDYDRSKIGGHQADSNNYETPFDGVATERSVTRSPDHGFVNQDDYLGDNTNLGEKPTVNRWKGGQEFRQRHDQPRSLRRTVSRGDDYYYRNNQEMNEPQRPTRSPLMAYLKMRDRVSMFDNDSSNGSYGSASSFSVDEKLAPDDYHQNGHGYMRSSDHPSRYYSPEQLEHGNNGNNNSEVGYNPYLSNYQQPNRSQPPTRNYSPNLTVDNRRSEPSSPGTQQYGSPASRRDSSLQHSSGGGYVYDMRNYPPDPLPPTLPPLPPPPPPPPMSDIQSYQAPNYNSTTYAPNLYSPQSANNYQQQRAHYHQQYSTQDDNNYSPPTVPNGYSRPESNANQPNYYQSQQYHPNQQQQQQQHRYNAAPSMHPSDSRYPQASSSSSADTYQRDPYKYTPPLRNNHYQTDPSSIYSHHPSASHLMQHSSIVSSSSSQERGDNSRNVNDYLKRVQFSDSDRDKLMASYLTCDGLLNDNDHCLERLSCEFSDPQNIERANKLDRAVSSILLGHILINTYIPNQFKLRLKSASLFGYTQSGKCSRFVCNKLSRPNTGTRT